MGMQFALSPTFLIKFTLSEQPIDPVEFVDFFIVEKRHVVCLEVFELSLVSFYL
jgi:hypothetical protein